MTSKSGFKIENPFVLLFAIFYIVAGIAQIGYFTIEISAAPPHLPILGIFSLVTAYSLFKLKKWSIFLVASLFATGVAFGATTLNASIIVQTFGGALQFHLALIIYIIMVSVAFIYFLLKRSNFN